MAPARYHIEPDYRVIAREAAVGKARFPDELLFEFVSALDPPALSPEYMDALRSFLCPEAGRGQGRRKSTDIDRADLLQILGRVSTDETAVGFATALIKRLKSPKRYTRYDSDLRFYKYMQDRDRDNLIRGLYHDLKPILSAGKPCRHEIFGELQLDKVDHSLPLMERALSATEEVMAALGKRPMLSLEGMRNLVGESREHKAKRERRFRF